MKVLKFGAEWCTNCKIVTSWISQLDLPVEIVEIDIDEDLATGALHKVRGLPTLVMLDDTGVEVKRLTQTPKTMQALSAWLTAQ